MEIQFWCKPFNLLLIFPVTESLDMNDFYDDCYDIDDEDSDYADQDDEADGADDSGNENA